jgi:BTB And C-terminal Kelch/BTB/POZ domain
MLTSLIHREMPRLCVRGSGPSLVLGGFARLLRDAALADVTVRCVPGRTNTMNAIGSPEGEADAASAADGGGRFRAHRCVLAAQSEFFRGTFARPYGEIEGSGDSGSGIGDGSDEFLWRDGASGEIVLHEVDPDVFSVLLQFMYTGELVFGASEDEGRDAVDVLAELSPALVLSDRLGIGAAKDVITQFLTARLSPDNAFEMLALASKFSVHTLRMECVRLLAQQFAEVSSREEFLDLDANDVRSLVASDALEPREEQTFLAVERWCFHNLRSLLNVDSERDGATSAGKVDSARDEQILGSIQGILDAVRFPLMEPRFLSLQVKQSRLMLVPALKTHLQGLLLEAFELHAFPESPAAESSPRNERRAKRRTSSRSLMRRSAPAEAAEGSASAGEGSDSDGQMDMIEFLRTYPPPSNSKGARGAKNSSRTTAERPTSPPSDSGRSSGASSPSRATSPPRVRSPRSSRSSRTG